MTAGVGRPPIAGHMQGKRPDMPRDNQTDTLWRRFRTAVFSPAPGWAPQSDQRSIGRQRFAIDAPDPSPRILVLTSELGSGHARAAQAIRLAILRRMPSATVQVLDWWSLMHVGVAGAAKEMYLELVQAHPELYERIYRLGEGTWRELLSGAHTLPGPVRQLLELIRTLHGADSIRPARGPYASDRTLFSLVCSTPSETQSLIAAGMRAKLAVMKWSWARLVRRLRSKIAAFQPDAIVATQMIPAALASAIKVSAIKQHRRMNTPSVAVPTDFGVHDFWHQLGTDWYCLGHEMLAELPVGLDATRVSVTGLPLMPEFAAPIDAKDARRHLGLGDKGPVILVLGGGLGLGVDSVAARLLQANVGAQLLVLRGQNANAGLGLDALATHSDARLRVYDWTDRMDVFIRAADIVVGKPGGLTVAEALACGRPLLATRSLHGQEGFNVRFLERHDVGKLLSDDELIQSIDTLLRHPQALAALKERAWRLGRREGAERIAEQVATLSVQSNARATRKRGWQSSRSH
jgi:processive 1,2-diacylglycerol beta-glucosyltransferase